MTLSYFAGHFSHLKPYYLLSTLENIAILRARSMAYSSAVYMETELGSRLVIM